LAETTPQRTGIRPKAGQQRPRTRAAELPIDAPLKRLPAPFPFTEPFHRRTHPALARDSERTHLFSYFRVKNSKKGCKI